MDKFGIWKCFPFFVTILDINAVLLDFFDAKERLIWHIRIFFRKEPSGVVNSVTV
jgi:hypothetical protein